MPRMFVDQLWKMFRYTDEASDDISEEKEETKIFKDEVVNSEADDPSVRTQKTQLNNTDIKNKFNNDKERSDQNHWADWPDPKKPHTG